MCDSQVLSVRTLGHTQRISRATPQQSRQYSVVLGARIDVTTGPDLLRELEGAISSRPVHMGYLNAHSLNLAYRNETYRNALQRCAYLLNDGVGLSIAARMRGVNFPDDLNGSDFTLRILALTAQRNWGVFLYGGRPGVAELAANELARRVPGVRIVGVRDGFSFEAHEVARRVRESGADAVLVALGNPLQELWLDEWLPETGCRLGVGVGAFLDFVSGRVRRAPPWMHAVGLEWIYRLCREPRRLARRYVIGNPLFLYRAWRLRAQEHGLRSD
jgi:exopolysaccharide biosynthesis WecB/TagA/CpsF family protein